MFLILNHQKLDVYSTSQMIASECYRICNHLPADERFAMISQIRRAALSVHLNIAEGSSRKSLKERKRYYEIARGSIVEIDAEMDVAKSLNYLDKADLTQLGQKMILCFKLLTGLLNSSPEE
jgi:four helix bundle protein